MTWSNAQFCGRFAPDGMIHAPNGLVIGAVPSSHSV
jgi:hypothetical protein